MSSRPVCPGTGPKAAPRRLRLTNVVAHRAPARFVAAATADRVRRERFAQHVGERLRRVARRRSRIGRGSLRLSRSASPSSAGWRRRRARCLGTVPGASASRVRARRRIVRSSGSAPCRTTEDVWFQRVRSDRTRSSRSAGVGSGVSPADGCARDSSSPRSASRSACLASRSICVAPLVAFEERVTGGAEALPDGLRLVPAHGADRLPLGLQPSDLRGGPVPLAGGRELLGPGAERFLLREVRRPRFLAFRQVGVASREELVAGVAETLPGRARVVARDGADLLPLVLQLLQLVGGLDPVGRVGERLGALDESPACARGWPCAPPSARAKNSRARV